MNFDNAVAAWIAAHPVEFFSAIFLVLAYIALGAWAGKGRH